jgi:7-cyano-7-deazaguanine synthase
VQPIYVSAGLAWEAAERAAVEAFLRAAELSAVRPLASLAVDMRDIYAATHWSVTGRPPGYHTPDEDVYLPGRNIVLLGKAAILCASAGIERLAIGTLDHNPFPDATPEFRAAMGEALSLGLGHPLRIEAPYARLSKSDVITRGVQAHVPLALTLSCMNPIAASAGFPRHCGLCSKCRERHDAFLAAGVDDPTDYADLQFVRA